jgi:penicillin-binding protein 1C
MSTSVEPSRDMSDEQDKRPQDHNYGDEDRRPEDDDVPFHLPKTEDDDDAPTVNIHKEDTEDIVIPAELIDDDDSEGVTVPREALGNDDTDQEDIAALHASDPPLERGRPEDDSILMGGKKPVFRSRDDHEDHDDDDDVPFRLPRERDDDSREDDGLIGHKWVTMPNQPQRDSAPTLPGSGGLDPNPDFADPNRTDATMPQVTIQHPRDQQWQRQVQQPTIPRQRPVQPPLVPPGRQAAKKQALPQRRRKRRFNPGCMAILIGVFVTFCGGLTLFTSVAGAFAYARVGNLLNERIEEVDRYAAFQSTFLYDRNGQLLYEVFGEGRRTNVRLEDMPAHLINATIAIEDGDFYNNIGIDVAATSVAFMLYLRADPDATTPGGSTITQQLVRNVLFEPQYRAERSVRRKAEEIMLAIALSGRKSKDEILELYLNEIYYGNLAYGAQAAAQAYFSKNASELTLGEAALLAALPQAPADLDPLNPDPAVQAAVERRWRQVLDQMVRDGYISSAERDRALSEGLSFSSPDVPLRAPHFTVYARNQLEQLMLDLGYDVEDIARGGLQVYTTVDVRLHDMVQQIARDQVAGLRAQNVGNAAVTVLKPTTGEILAMVGSIDYNNEAIDGRVNVTTSMRQPGSTVKAFNYAAAIERGWSPGDVIWDTRTRIGIPGGQEYVPRNYDNSFHGPMRMRYALGNSYNIPAVQVLRYVGVEYLLETMHRFGMRSLGTDASRYGLSLTLGGGEVTLLGLTRGYATFANQGSLVETTPILCILDNDDNIIYQYEGGCPKGNVTSQTVARSGLGTQILDPRIAFLISDILADNRARTPAMGASSALHTPGIPTSVKTGTTDDVRDNWTVGYTRNVAVGVWVGNSDGTPMARGTSGLTGAAPIWNNVITRIYNTPHLLNEFAVDGQLLSDQIQPPAGMSLRQICDVRALMDPAPGCPATTNEWFLDSPAGLPDGRGGLDYPAPQQRQPEQPPATGSYVREVDSGIYQTAVYRLAPEISHAIQFTLAPGQRQPPPPIYCRVPMELLGSTPEAQELLFIKPPPVQDDAVEAEEYARAHGYAFLPTIDCTPELITAPQHLGPAIVTAVISSPQPNEVISGSVPIYGTAQFTQQQAMYYKLEIIGGEFGNWTTIGPVRYESVVNGQLDTLPALPPGSYRLRLVLIGTDANILQQPYEVPFSVQ